MKKLTACICAWLSLNVQAQQIDQSYLNYDFKAGEKTIFEDNFNYTPSEKISDHWEFMDGGGAASIKEKDNEKLLSFDAYYTRLKPKIFGNKKLPEDFSIEYDAWLDASYDGNPGVVIVFEMADGNRGVSITPNKHSMSVTLPNNESVSKDNPDPYFGEGKFFNRWVHIAAAVHKKQLKVYMDQYKMLEVNDILSTPAYVMLYGDKSGEAGDGLQPIYLKNFRLATGFPAAISFENGKFVTRNIKFDVNKAVLKPESITVINDVKKYMEQNATVKLEIDGHTDSDGNDENNLKLSEQRALAVKQQLVALGINDKRLAAKGMGETVPIDKNNTAEGKANNRRVEFVVVK